MPVRIPKKCSCASAAYPKDCGPPNCTQGTKNCGCRNLPPWKLPPYGPRGAESLVLESAKGEEDGHPPLLSAPPPPGRSVNKFLSRQSNLL